MHVQQLGDVVKVLHTFSHVDLSSTAFVRDKFCLQFFDYPAKISGQKRMKTLS